MGKRGFVFVALIAVAAWAQPPGQTLGTEGGRFTLDGRAHFLVFISYFDAMRTSLASLESDFRYLRTNGFDGIRIFPNWWDFRTGIRFASDTLIDGNGHARLDRLVALKNVLDLAARHGLLVDVSFAYETVEGLSELRSDQVGTSQGALPVNRVHIDDYELGLIQITRELRAYRNIFFDIQNEYNGRITHLDDDEVRRLCATIKTVDPKRLVTASLANEIGPEEVARRSNEVGVDIVGWHESRNPWRFYEMDELVRRAKSETTKPVYLGEPAVLDDGLAAQDFVTAATTAKAGGAAAWTFHTRNGFDLSRKSLADSMTEAEKSFVSTVRAHVDAAKWGVDGPANVGK
jgi:hypothetical protein